MRFDADIQNGIVMFLNGETYCSSYSIDEMVMSRFARAGSAEEIETLNRTRFLEEAEDLLVHNGMPTRCFGCDGCNHSNVESYKDARNMTTNYRKTMRCEARGCDQAREDFLQNFSRIEKKGGACVELDVQVNKPEPMRMPMLGGGMTYIAPPPAFEDCIKISSRRLTTIDPDAFKSSVFEIDPNINKRVRETVKNTYSSQVKAEEKELEELAQLFDSGEITLKDKPADYGEVVW